MEDSTAMTVEFLRARLLSERSVSRSAKQRADELAKKVLELEEQLQIATMQRKKIEKATIEVLEILDNSGISDFSESIDSNSDQEGVVHESKKDNNSMKEEEENAMSGRSTRSESSEISGLEHDASLLSGRSLSWKGCSDSPNPLQKKKYMELRKQHSFVSTCDSSAKRLAGKSCRKIKRREAIEALKNGVANGSEDTFNYEKDESAHRALLNGEGHLETQQGEIIAGLDVSESPSNNTMERAVENQGKLISEYEAEENAQTEWEKKIEENDRCTPDSHDNQSNLIEKMEDSSKCVQIPATMSSEGEQANLNGEEAYLDKEALAKIASGDTPSSASYLGVGSSQEQPCSNNLNDEVRPDPEFSFPSQEIPGSSVKCQEKQEQSDALGGSSEHPSTNTFPLDDDGSQHSGESSSGIKNELQIEVWREKPNELSDVLEALQRAKFSLKNELNRPPLTTPSWPVVNMKETVHPETDSIESIKVPNYWAGLFRVPTELECKGTTQYNFLPHFEPKTNLSRNQVNVGISRIDQNGISPNLEMGSRNYSPKPYFDPWIDAGFALPATSGNRFKYHSNTESMPNMSSKNFVPQTYPSSGSELLMGGSPTIYSNFDRLNIPYRF